MINTLTNFADQPIATFVFAHGAGAGQDSDFMQFMADKLVKHNINVVRFNFAYMALAKELGKRRPPDRADKLLNHFKLVLGQLDSTLPFFIGGKSMGGRIASMLVEESEAKAAICMGYPFHPPGKPEKLRTAHLIDIHKPVLVIQGERDAFGHKAEVQKFVLSKQVHIEYLTDGDHSFKPRKASGVTLESNLSRAVELTAGFIRSRI